MLRSRQDRSRAVRVQRPRVAKSGGRGGVVQSPPGSGRQLAVAIAAAAAAGRIRLRTATTARMGAAAAAVGRVERLLRLRPATAARMGAAAVGRVERPHPEVAATTIRARLAGVQRLGAVVHRVSACVHRSLRASPSMPSGTGMVVERPTPEVAALTLTTRARHAAGVHRLGAGVHRLLRTTTVRATVM